MQSSSYLWHFSFRFFGFAHVMSTGHPTDVDPVSFRLCVYTVFIARLPVFSLSVCQFSFHQYRSRERGGVFERGFVLYRGLPWLV